jgi:hypothetical protein
MLSIRVRRGDRCEIASLAPVAIGAHVYDAKSPHLRGRGLRPVYTTRSLFGAQADYRLLCEFGRSMGRRNCLYVSRSRGFTQYLPRLQSWMHLGAVIRQAGTSKQRAAISGTFSNSNSEASRLASTARLRHARKPERITELEPRRLRRRNLCSLRRSLRQVQASVDFGLDDPACPRQSYQMFHVKAFCPVRAQNLTRAKTAAPFTLVSLIDFFVQSERRQQSRLNAPDAPAIVPKPGRQAPAKAKAYSSSRALRYFSVFSRT